MPAVLVYAAVALTGIIITGIVIAKIASHFDGTAASAAYTDSVVKREQSLLNLHAQGYSFEAANRALGEPPKKPEGFKTGTFATVLILGGAAAVAVALFGGRVVRSLKGTNEPASA